MFRQTVQHMVPRVLVGAGAALFAGSAAAESGPTSSMHSYPANSPIEDRKVVYDISPAIKAATVLDGHGGWQCAEFAMNAIPHAIQAERALHGTDAGADIRPEDLGQLLDRAYKRVDRSFAASVRESFALGFESVARVGACALTVAVAPKHLVVANAGDCRAVLAVSASGDKWEAVDLSRDHNARTPEEKQSLAAAHPGESDIVLCKHPSACYVKGRLQPTRSFGDLYLKHSEFNGPPSDRTRGRHIPVPYTPPYITAEPELTVRERQPEDKLVVIASDGLWDAMSSQEVVSFLQGILDGSDRQSDAAERLVMEALRREAEAARMSLPGLMELPPGRQRRRLHDDITAVVLFLDSDAGKAKSSSWFSFGKN